MVVSQCQTSFRFNNITSITMLPLLSTERCDIYFPCYLYLLALVYLGADTTGIIENLPQAKAASESVKANNTCMFLYSCSTCPIIS